MMTLYSRAVDARCHRVRLVLAEKALKSAIEDYYKKSKTPA